MRLLTALIATALTAPVAMAQTPVAAPSQPATATPAEKQSAQRRVSPQGAAAPTAATAKPVTRTATKPTDKHATQRRVAAAAVASPEPAELDEDRMAVVPRVMVGEKRCDAGKTVSVQPHANLPGRFVLAVGKEQHTVTPQPTTTGVIRLENAHAGVVWLQVPVKSMMMDAKKGHRLADNCIHPLQAAEIEAMKAQPAQ
jgi:hypothetical protein